MRQGESWEGWKEAVCLAGWRFVRQTVCKIGRYHSSKLVQWVDGETGRQDISQAAGWILDRRATNSQDMEGTQDGSLSDGLH